MFGRKIRTPDVPVPDARFRDVKLPDIRLPDVRLPDVRMPNLHLPDVHMPELHMPHVHMPDLHLPNVSLPSRMDLPGMHVPSFQLGGGQVAGMRVPEWRTPELRTPELELIARNGFQIRRKRANPLWVALKLVVGVGLGLFAGCLIAALVTPSAGEDTRRKLRAMLPGSAADEAAPVGARPALPTSSDADNGPLDALKARFRHAIDEAKKARQQRERELKAEFETAKRTGSAP